MDWLYIACAFLLGSLFGVWLDRTYLKLQAIADINRRPEGCE